uniref:Uncharacterized protein n=1 Tax=viral metagenome TaxID=1070528 RepID=A0A6M3J0W4_9ZZZZ
MPEFIQHNLQGLIINKWYSVDAFVVNGLENIIQVDRATFNALTKYHIVDSGQVRLMTQVEKDQLDAWEAQKAEQAETDRMNALDDLIESSQLSGLTLARADTAIDNIGDLADAKVFLKKLCRFIIKFISRQ